MDEINREWSVRTKKEKRRKKGKKDAVRQRSMPNDLLCISPRLLRAKVGNPAFSCLYGQVTFPYDRTDSRSRPGSDKRSQLTIPTDRYLFRPRHYRAFYINIYRIVSPLHRRVTETTTKPSVTVLCPRENRKIEIELSIAYNVELVHTCDDRLK